MATKQPCYTMQVAAKMLGYGPNKLFAWLREQHIFNSQNMPQQSHIDAGRFVVTHGSFMRGPVKHHYARTCITSKGIDWLQQQLNCACANHQTTNHA